MINIQDGFLEFNQVLTELEGRATNYEAWFHYYQHYQQVFDQIFTNIYHQEVEDFQAFLNDISLGELYEQAQLGSEILALTPLSEIVNECMKFFHVSEVDLYFLVGLGHIDGAVPPIKEPFLFFGLERLAHVDLSLLVPHEFNHFVRFQALFNQENFESPCVKQLLVAEGLATVTPLMIQGKSLNETNIMEALMMSPEQFHLIKQDEDQHVTHIMENLERSLLDSEGSQFFIADAHSELPQRVGYYVGTKVITELLQNGYDLRELTTLPTNEVCSLYQKLKKSNDLQHK